MSYVVYLNGYQSFKLYMAVKLHFSTDGYDIFEQKARTKFPEDKFLGRPDKNFFHSLGQDYLKGDLADFYMSNIMAGKEHVSEFDHATFREWKSKIHRLDYLFEEDCKMLQKLFIKYNVTFNDLWISATGELPLVLQLLNGGHINIETVCCINTILQDGIIMRFDEQIRDKLIWPSLRNRIIKYSPWIKTDISTLKKILVNYTK